MTTHSERRSLRSRAPDRVRRVGRRMAKFGLFLLSLVLFVWAITLMKEGAHGLVPLVRDVFQATDPWRSLGFGWLAAYIIMSGSPVAAMALTFMDAGALSLTATFTMITGSRLGAGFIVIFLGFLYILRGRSRTASLTMGLLAFCVTASTYLAGLGIGIWLLNTPRFTALHLQPNGAVQARLERLWGPAIDRLSGWLPPWGLFALGLLAIILSFSLFDRCLPAITLKESQVGQLSRLVYAPWIMLLLGGVVTLISMSVSISLGILVPLSHRGLIRRENVIPYIMGANITTFIDTLLASLLLDNPAGFTVVLAEMVSIGLVSAFVLSVLYRRYTHWMLGFVEWTTASNRHLLLFMTTILLMPVLLLLL